MVLVCKHGARLHVHSLILSKWSLVIGSFPGVAQRRNSIDGAKEGLTEFPVDDPPDVWRAVLGLLYPVTPVTELDWDNVESIYELADKYNMPGVVERCESFLMSPRCSLSPNAQDNNYVLKWLAFSASYRQHKLKEKCMQYIRLTYRSIDELRNPPEGGYLRSVLANHPAGVQYIVDILSFVMQQRR
ncbi:unnamed protein product [Ostreobium quekettii]|uniref:BTB domain-containing protein n=1 Tax=Ostreobium quekettii TaxID=121088 RepID=A0A8S1IKE1_9CHLO|nr:unnamed protein product [Ostreobium quekettii]